MEIKITADAHGTEQEVPLLSETPKEIIEERTLIQKAIRQTFQSTAHLANLLPTGITYLVQSR